MGRRWFALPTCELVVIVWLSVSSSMFGRDPAGIREIGNEIACSP
jgi:hypothetical protein